MKALVYHGPNQKSWEEVPNPKIVDPTDVIVQVDTTTICGTDLHILKGDVPAVTDGRILGHEGVGTITEVGSAVSKLVVGDRVIISCITSCGSCSYCHQQLPAHCLNKEGASGIGWIFGHLIDGTQAEYVRVPFAESSLHKLPAGVTDEAAVMLSDIMPTGFEIGVRNGKVQPGDVVAVVGAGPVGLSAMMTAGLYGASRIIAIDLDQNRLEQARNFGATDSINSGKAGWMEELMAMTDDAMGVDVAIEAVGGAEAPGPVDQGHRHHHRPGQRHHHTDAAQAGCPGPAHPREVREPPVHLRHHPGRLRHLQSRRRDQGPQGDHHPLTQLSVDAGRRGGLISPAPRSRRDRQRTHLAVP
jgi:alcohol dehydrogenase